MKNNNKKGFTLIETMVTLTVIGALTALAVPAYQDYTIKSQVAEAFVATEALKKEVINQKSLTDSFNKDLVKIDSDTLKINDDGNVSYIFKNKNKEINNKLVMFILDDTKTGAYKWNCVTDINSKYLPKSTDCIIDNIDNDNNDSEETKETYLYDDEVLFFGIGNMRIFPQFIRDNSNLTFVLDYGTLRISDDNISFISNNYEQFDTKFKTREDLEDILFNNRLVNDNKNSVKGFISQQTNNSLINGIKNSIDEYFLFQAYLKSNPNGNPADDYNNFLKYKQDNPL